MDTSASLTTKRSVRVNMISTTLLSGLDGIVDLVQEELGVSTQHLLADQLNQLQHNLTPSLQ